MKLFIVIFFIIISCNKKTSENEDSKFENSNNFENSSDSLIYEEDSNESNNSESIDESSQNAQDDKIADGSHSAIVDYYNPKTGYSATYDLDVDVENGEVVRINFPKGGWLDDDIHPSESRLKSEELDDNRNATLKDENGRTFEVQIDN
jgi:hypothetical protein